MSRNMTLEEMEKVIKDNGLSEIVYNYFTDSDFVKVVRCKDCKYRSRYISKIAPGLQFWECKHDCGCAKCDNDYGFCSYGERKETE